jgi:hypothetical protein
MSAPGLNPGDRVVDLAALAHSAAVITGAVAATWLTWRIRRIWPLSSAAFVGGAAVGYIVSELVARVLYRGPGRATTVVKVGAAALGNTLRAGLSGSLLTAVVVALLVVAMFLPKDDQRAGPLFMLSLYCGAVVGALFACLASFL